MKPGAGGPFPGVRPTVLVYRNVLLNQTETFISEQVRALSRWKAVLVGERLMPDGLQLDGLSTALLLPESIRGMRRWLYRVCRYANFADPGVSQRLRQLGPRLIHAHFGPSGVEMWPYARALRLHLLVTLHNLDIRKHTTEWRKHPSNRRYRLYPTPLLRMPLFSPSAFAGPRLLFSSARPNAILRLER